MTLLVALRNLLIALIGAYGISTTGFLALRFLVGESWTVIAVFNSFAHLLMLPALLLVPVLLLLRRPRLLVLLAAPAIFMIVTYGPVFIPREPVSADTPRLHLLTYNIMAQTDASEPIAIIREAGADVVALQELGADAAAQIADELAEMYPHQALHPVPGDDIAGGGILSRVPLLDDEFWQIHLGHQRVVLDMDGWTITIFNTHPVQPFIPGGFEKRGEEIRAVLARAQATAGPVIVMGDFNMSDLADPYADMTAHFTDAYRQVGWGMGFTFPAGRPYFGYTASQPPPELASVPLLVRLDYIFHSAAFRAVSAQVWPEAGGSDHRPLWVALEALNTP